jgi:hypothetical protein
MGALPTASLTERQVAALFMFGRLLAFAENLGIKLIMTAFVRTSEQQNSLFRQGLSRCDGFVRRSKHQDRLAFDIVVLDSEWKPTNNYGDAPEYPVLGAEWERLGGTWGGHFGSTFLDVFHFEGA